MFPQPLFAQNEPSKACSPALKTHTTPLVDTPTSAEPHTELSAGVGDVKMTLHHLTGQVMDKVSGRGFVSQRHLHPRHKEKKRGGR